MAENGTHAPERWRAAHGDLSALDLKFREIAHTSPELLDRSQFRILDENSEPLSFRLQSWPTFLGASKLEEFKRVSLGINRLLRTAPERIFGNDPQRLSDFYGIGSRSVAQVLLLPPTGAETMISRGDFIATADGWKCIEFNFSPKLGGWDTTIITGLQLSVPAIARFIAGEGLRVEFTDTIVEMFRHILEDLRRKGILRSGDVTIAFLTKPEDLPVVDRSLAYLNRELRRTIEAMGLDVEGRLVRSSYDRLEPGGGGLLLDDRRVDALVELSGRTSPQAYRLFKGDRIGLYNGPLSHALSSKRTLALLSQHAASEVYSPEERAVLDAHLPWTRLVAPGTVEHEGESRPLGELLTARRERFVLKDADSWGGRGVLLGRSTPPERWREAVDGALAEGNWVVQEMQESLPYLYQSGDYGCCVHDLIWGPFVFGDRYGGAVLRMQPKAMGGPVNASLNATEGIALEV